MKYFLGIDLGGTNMAIGIVDGKTQIVASHSVPTRSYRSFEEVVKDMALTVKDTLQRAGLKETDIDYVGIGVPSTIDPKTKKLLYANNLGWKNRDLITEFKKHWDIDVFVGNDADCAALGEAMSGEAKQYDSVLVITIGTGVGGGMILNKRIFIGGDGTGFEPGHLIIKEGGTLCTCGAKGCLEAYASTTALIRQTIDQMLSCPNSLMWEVTSGDLNHVSGYTAFQAAKRGDEAALQVIDTFLEYLSAGLSSLIAVFRPQIIIIGGGISKQGEYLLAPLREKTDIKSAGTGIMKPVPIFQARFGNDAGIIGAALLGEHSDKAENYK